ncbi:MAG: aminotransferase class I/II-fold pyridoxal phosphate-dependent enzyme [Candidatus Omnitrophica bacterium]|nr:aminotransferase class I/II-fold pyridoxal phosphate-dependent enzyme [Candidatus Omnitrophota bacterium]MDD5591885.1 aminotransferase class I/II-fold pyridoxal phosphate-dependent enzyme [Candidatus Omnitrophota bacterium]
MFIELDAPNIGRLEKNYINTTIDKGFISTYGPYVSEFEEKFAKYLETKKAVSTQSGTAALHIALYELRIGKGDEVIVPNLTFIATVNPVIYVGAKPVFVDVDIRTWNISPEKIEKKITKKTRAIIPVHFYGNPCNMDEIMKIARKYNIYVIEDATESLGAKYKGKYTGTYGDLGCFSFNGNKIITTGGGGMVVGNSKKRLGHIKFLVNQARDESRGYFYPEVGFNYRMTNIEAVLGLAQLKRLNGFLAKKKRFKAIYRNEMKGIRNIRFQDEYEGADSSSWLTCITFGDKVDIVILRRKLSVKGIPTRRIFMPVTEFPPYKKYRQGRYDNSRYIYEKGLCLPSSTLNSENDIRYICKIIKESL